MGFSQTNMQQKESPQEDQFVRYMDEEIKHGFRLSWNVWYPRKSELEVVPLGCLYTPLNSCGIVGYEPAYCTKCHSVLCPSSTVDLGSHSWTCSFCGGRNHLPRELLNDQNFIENKRIEEIDPENSTIEYITHKTSAFSPVFVFIVDRCTYDEKRHMTMISGLRQAVDLLPDDALVVFIEAGTNIELFTFSDKRIKTIFQYSGDSEYQKKDIRGLGDMKEIIVKKSEKYNEIIALIDRLEIDPFPVAPGTRTRRCLGAAISFATSLMDGPFVDSPVKYLLFTQGPCTYGPGQTATLEITSNENVNLDSALEFYNEQGKRIARLGHSIDVIAETLADIGLQQMNPLTSLTGGIVILAQDFEERIKTKSLEVMYTKTEEGILSLAFNVKMSVKTTPNVTFKGFVGDGYQSGNAESKEWRIGCLVPSANITLLFEGNELSKHGGMAHVQIVTKYNRSDKTTVVRTTSFTRPFSKEFTAIKQSFDWEAAAILQSRLFCLKNYEKVLDMETAIDRHLIKFTKRYAEYIRNNPGSLKFEPSYSEYVNFLFFFRRSQVVQKEGISYDENTYFRQLLFRLRIFEALKLVKPVLVQFHYQGEATEVPLDISSLNPETMIVLDSFHNVLLWYGQDVEAWKRQGIQENPEYAFFKRSLESAEEYAESLLEDRLPVPQYRKTAAGLSQERILLTLVNPSSSGMMNTQKIDYDKFYRVLAKHVVQNE